MSNNTLIAILFVSYALVFISLIIASTMGVLV